METNMPAMQEIQNFQSHGVHYSFMESIIFSFILFLCVCELAHGNPLQYSCLENPMDGGAW